MSGYRFEWIRCAGSNWTQLTQSLPVTDPCAWKLAPAGSILIVHAIDEAPGWYVPVVVFRLPGARAVAVEGLRLLGQFWVYNVHFIHDNDNEDQELFSDGKLILREVPTCLVFNCNLTILDDKHFQAAFTNLAGNELLQVVQVLPPKLTMGCLAGLMKAEVDRLNLLQSHNQEVRVLLNGATSELDCETILWNSLRPIRYLHPEAIDLHVKTSSR